MPAAGLGRARDPGSHRLGSAGSGASGAGPRASWCSRRPAGDSGQGSAGGAEHPTPFVESEGRPEPDARGFDAGRVKRETRWKARQNTTFAPGPSGAGTAFLLGSGLPCPPENAVGRPAPAAPGGTVTPSWPANPDPDRENVPMKCPRCQHENEAGAKFCEECAAPLAWACAKCGRPLAADRKVLPRVCASHRVVGRAASGSAIRRP